MSMIIGVALVVDDIRKGQRLAFRYPESVPSFVINTGEVDDISHCLTSFSNIDDSLLQFHESYLSLR
jgi:hypothetical protein